MKDKRVIPQNILQLMSPEDRKQLGVRTNEEIEASVSLQLERDIHRQFAGFLYRHGFEDFYWSDPVRRPTIKAGLPDFGVYKESRIIWIEFKCGKNGLSESQEQCFERMGRQGNIIMVCHSSPEAEKIVTKFFNLP